MFDGLMAGLGYDRYLVHGGDRGAHVTSLLGLRRPDRVVGIRSTALCLRQPGAEQLTGETPDDASQAERSFVAHEHGTWQTEGAYSQVRRTKPAKLGCAMLDSPVGTAAWILEVFPARSDRASASFERLFSPDQLLTEVMLYLVTDAFPTSTLIYGAKRFAERTLPAGRRMEVPTALAAFRDPVFPMPPRELAERSHRAVRCMDMLRGQHFPFSGAADLLVEDLRTFRRLVPSSQRRA